MALIPLKHDGYRRDGTRLYFFDLGSSAPAPDPSIGQAQTSLAQNAADTLAFNKQIYADNQPYLQSANDLALKNAQSQLDLSNQQAAIAQDTNNYNINTFRPLEQQIVNTAENYDTPGREETVAGQNAADVGSQFDAQRTALASRNASMGVDPSSGNAQATLGDIATQEAAAKAAAANAGRLQVQNTANTMQLNAASLGRNLPANQVAQAGSATQAGNAAVNSADQTISNVNATAAPVNTGYSLADSAYGTSGNLGLGSYQQQSTNANRNSGVFGALGNVVGSFAGSDTGSTMIGNGIGAIGSFLSDKTKKTNIKANSKEASLAAVRKTPVAKWTYKKGAGDGGTHTGPMAQDVRKTLGDSVAPGGKKIDLISMNGHTMAAIQALDKKVTKLSLALAKRK